MKKIFTLVFCTILSGCSTTPFYINQAMKAKERNYTDKLANLEAVYEDEASLKVFSVSDSFVQVNTPEATRFYREVEKNLLDPYTEKKGYIVLTPILSAVNEQEIFDQETSQGVIAICTLGLSLIFNAPKVNYKGFSELEIRILDKNGKIIKKYSSEGISLITYGPRYQCLDCKERVKWEAYENALDDILEQIYRDRTWLKRRLNALY